MNRILRAEMLALLALVSPALLPAQQTAASSSKPNIILILSDDMDYTDLSITGGTKTPTPNIDSIAKNGVQFTQAYVSCPVCGPSRVAILTGKYQDRVGFVTNHGPKIPENFGLPSTEVLIPEVLKTVGYKTGMIGKWHLGFNPGMIPNDQGFDYYFGHLHGAHDYRPGVEKPGPILRNTEVVKTTKWLTTTFAEEAAKFIHDNSASPYFLYVPFNAVHDPHQASDELKQKFSHIKDDFERTMATMLYEMDEGVGKILHAVKATGDEDNTLIVFFNDNGGPRGHLPESNGILRGGKGTVYEGGIRVPLFMKWPGKIKPGTKYEKPVIGMDLMPTFLAAANTKSTSTLEGVNLLPYINGTEKGKPHQSLFWRYIDASNQHAARKDDLKIVQPAQDKPWELYDLSTDPGETKNLASQMSDKVKEISAEWQKWNSINKEPLWLDARIVRQRENLKPTDGNTTGPNTAEPPARRRRNRQNPPGES